MKHRALTLAPSEAEAIERAKQGDAEAFALLYGLHKRRIYSLCLRMTANSAKAEDLTQEAFLQLFRKIGTFRGESAFSTWLHRMAVNVVLMQLRKKSLPVIPLEETLESEEETPKKELGAPDPVLSGSIDRLRLQRAVEALPPGYRRIFVLHDVEGYEHNEIATMVGCSIGNSKSQLHKARMKLRELLKTSRAEKAATHPSEQSLRALEENGPQIVQAGNHNHASTNVRIGFGNHPGAFPEGVSCYVHAIG